MIARVISIPRGAAGGVLLRELGEDKLVAYTGVDAADGRHYYVAVPRGAVPAARACASALAAALNGGALARVQGGADGVA